MLSLSTRARSAGRWIAGLGLASALASTSATRAQEADTEESEYESEPEEESSFTVNAMIKMQGGMFVPLASDGFQPHDNVARSTTNPNFAGTPCDPVISPARPCYPRDHGQDPGSPSISRATLQLEAHWDFSRKLSLHAIVRGARMGQTEADERAQVPRLLDRLPGESNADLGKRRRAYSKRWVQDTYYNRLELREFYLDYLPLDWLSFRVGRQQVAWGETGQFRLLDVVNPIDSSWHFGPLESFEDQRVPLWMVLNTIDVNALKGALELLFIPGLDRARDMVSTPLSNVGAWGVPYSNQPGPYSIRYKDFQYPGGSLNGKYMRGGFRWKADLGDHATYSLVYMYTHMQTPVLYRADLTQRIDETTGQPIPGVYNDAVADRAVFKFPRQHVVGGSFEYVFDSPIGMTARFEGSVEPNRTFSTRTDISGTEINGQIFYQPRSKPVVNYALVLQRPTMIRWLNPTQNFLLVGQFMHTAVAGIGDDYNRLVQIVGYNDWRPQKNSYTLVAFATTNYMNGIITPRLTGVWVVNPYYQDSGYVSLDVGFRIGPHYRVNVTATDFIGKNPYRDLGFFRDRDELHASLTVLF